MTVRALLLGVFLMIMIGTEPVAGQPTVLVVTGNAPGADVVLDGVTLGRADSGPFRIPPGSLYGEIHAMGVGVWSVPPVSFTVDASAGDTLIVEAVFPYRYRINSLPDGANVYHLVTGSDRWLGETPLVYESAVPLNGKLRVSAPGFDPVDVRPGTDVWNTLEVTLPSTTGDLVGSGTVPAPRRRRWINVAALTGATVAGALAVHYRTKADNRFRTWEETGDPAVKARVQQLDRYSGVAVGTMQVGLGVFAFRLIF